MEKKWKVAVIGGHGLVTKCLIEDLFKYHFPLESLSIYGSKEKADIPLVINERTFIVIPLDKKTITYYDLVFFSGNENIAKEYAPDFIKKGAIVIDNSSYYRMHKDVPLVIPELNADDLLDGNKLYANPNCTTIMILLAVKPIHDKYKAEKIIVSSYQSASGAGTNALNEYYSEINNPSYKATFLPSSNVIKKNLFDNILPIVDDVLDNGYTKEEMKIRDESHKILHDASIDINVTCVRVPTTIGHGASIVVQFKEKIAVEEVINIWKSCPYLKVYQHPDYPSLLEIRHQSFVAVGRLRADLDCEYTISFFVTSNNLVRGASYNAVMMAFKLREIIK